MSRGQCFHSFSLSVPSGSLLWYNNPVGNFFSYGGPFYYEGFGFGSFMFANIASQVTGYYLIALVLLILGYGHLKTKKWAAKLSVSLLYFWLILGIPLIITVLFILAGTKELSTTIALLILAVSILSYAVFPPLLIHFYKNRSIVYTFEKNDKTTCWIERIPVSVLTLSWLIIFDEISVKRDIVPRKYTATRISFCYTCWNASFSNMDFDNYVKETFS